jgi:hypothetical protein
MADDVVRIRVGMCVDYIAGSTREKVSKIDRAEWDEMSGDDRRAVLDEMAEEYAADHVQSWARVEGEG